MADETKVQADAAAEAPAKVAAAVADTAEKVGKESAQGAKRTRASTARRIKREAAAEKAAVRRSARRTTRNTRNTRTAARKAAPKAARTAQKRIETVTTNFFNGFDAVPAFGPFQNIFAGANERGQDFAKRGQKVAEELADLARSKLEAIVEAGRVASEGAPALGQNRVASSRDGVEQTADAI